MDCMTVAHNFALHWTGSSRFSLFQCSAQWRLLPASELGVMCAETTSDRPQGSGDRMQEMKSLIRQAAIVMIHTRGILGLDQPPTKDEVVRWRPLLEAMAAQARRRRLEMSGITALRTFTQIWDERMRQMAEREDRPPFSLDQIRAMSAAITEFEAWLRTHFPGAFSRADH